MSFVFYDTETTGLATDFDQILQFAAIRTDADLNEIGRIEIRSHLQPHVIPHPEAMRVNGMTIGEMTTPGLPSHYEMMRKVRSTLLEWSPAIFVGYNSLNFDEHLLRQALFQTLHPPYLSNTNGNCRADVMHLLQEASVFEPSSIDIPRDTSGSPIFRLEDVARRNGFPGHLAHNALGDVLATIHLARCVRENAPDCWNRFVRFSKKASVAAFIEDEEAFVLTEFYYNRPYHYIVATFGKDPSQDNVSIGLDLRVNIDGVASLSDAQLLEFVGQSPKRVRRIRTNAAPMIASLEDVPDNVKGGLSDSEIIQRARRFKSDKRLHARLTAALTETKAERQISPFMEERLYDTFISRDDERRMEQFHVVDWPIRVQIVESLGDERLRHFGRRLIHAHSPLLLNPAHRAEVEHVIHSRLHAQSVPDGKWTSIPVAVRATEDLLRSTSGPVYERLFEYRGYLTRALATATS
jgi:exodeoxyribonuclease I